MEPKIKVVIEYGLPQGELVRREFNPSEPTSYRINDNITPGCLRLFWGKKTVIVPLVNLGLIELDL